MVDVKIFEGNRRSGKTTKAIDCAYLTDSLLVIPATQSVGLIRDQADEYLARTYGAKPRAIGIVSVRDVLNNHLRGKNVKNVVIDELDWTLDSVLHHSGVNANVLLATRNVEDYNQRPLSMTGLPSREPELAFSIRGKLFKDEESLKWLADAVKEKMERERNAQMPIL